MLTRLLVRNFKRFEEIDIELGNPVIFIGPNNSGKTTALQALAFWDIGVRRWIEKYRGKKAPEMRPGVAINRRDLIAIPIPDTKLLWRNLHIRDIKRINGSPDTQNVFIDIVVEGLTGGTTWRCGVEFYYANEESLYCRPSIEDDGKRKPLPELAIQHRVAFLPPMSGLASVEPKAEQGRINVLIGEGQTAQVLRNLCYRVYETDEKSWQRLCESIDDLFGVKLEPPSYLIERGEITMSYRENGILFDLSSSGRGLQQTLLLLAYIHANPGSVLLLDEPDAHLEILRQREIYRLITEIAREHDCQIIAASHSEVVLNEAAGRDMVIAFVGRRPHRLADQGSQLRKSLVEIRFEDYYQAEQTGWVLYLEGSTDLAILQAFARILGHPVQTFLERPFVRYVGNQPMQAAAHFNGLREAKPDLIGIAIYDRLDREPPQQPNLTQLCWRRREIENYLCKPEALLTYARVTARRDKPGVFAEPEIKRRVDAMQECINDLVLPVALRDPNDRWWSDVKASDEFLDRLFASYFDKLGMPNLMRKSGYYLLAEIMQPDAIAPEIVEKLDAIAREAGRAMPAET